MATVEDIKVGSAWQVAPGVTTLMRDPGTPVTVYRVEGDVVYYHYGDGSTTHNYVESFLRTMVPVKPPTPPADPPPVVTPGTLWDWRSVPHWANGNVCRVTRVDSGVVWFVYLSLSRYPNMEESQELDAFVRMRRLVSETTAPTPDPVPPAPDVEVPPDDAPPPMAEAVGVEPLPSIAVGGDFTVNVTVHVHTHQPLPTGVTTPPAASPASAAPFAHALSRACVDFGRATTTAKKDFREGEPVYEKDVERVKHQAESSPKDTRPPAGSDYGRHVVVESSLTPGQSTITSIANILDGCGVKDPDIRLALTRLLRSDDLITTAVLSSVIVDLEAALADRKRA